MNQQFSNYENHPLRFSRNLFCNLFFLLSKGKHSAINIIRKWKNINFHQLFPSRHKLCKYWKTTSINKQICDDDNKESVWKKSSYRWWKILEKCWDAEVVWDVSAVALEICAQPCHLRKLQILPLFLNVLKTMKRRRKKIRIEFNFFSAGKTKTKSVKAENYSFLFFGSNANKLSKKFAPFRRTKIPFQTFLSCKCF